jgi:hypothetical protein
MPVEEPEIRFIVDGLNQEPFNMGLTMVTCQIGCDSLRHLLRLTYIFRFKVSLDEKTNFEIVELFNDILVHLNKQTHGVDLRNETDEIRVFRWVEFLQLMRFQLPQDM